MAPSPQLLPNISYYFILFQTEEDANLAPQMGDGGFQFNPNPGAGGPDPNSMQGAGQFQFWKRQNTILL